MSATTLSPIRLKSWEIDGIARVSIEAWQAENHDWSARADFAVRIDRYSDDTPTEYFAVHDFDHAVTIFNAHIELLTWQRDFPAWLASLPRPIRAARYVFSRIADRLPAWDWIDHVITRVPDRWFDQADPAPIA